MIGRKLKQVKDAMVTILDDINTKVSVLMVTRICYRNHLLLTDICYVLGLVQYNDFFKRSGVVDSDEKLYTFRFKDYLMLSLYMFVRVFPHNSRTTRTSRKTYAQNRV